MLYQADKSGSTPVLQRVDNCCPDADDALDMAKDALIQAGDYVELGGGGPMLVSDPVFSLPAYVANRNTTVTFTATAQSYWSGHSVKYFMITVPALGIEFQAFAASGNSASISFVVPPEIAEDTEIAVTVSAMDDAGYQSKRVTKTTRVGRVEIAAPVITVPVSGSTVVTASGKLQVNASAFSSVGTMSDTHASSSWKLTADAEGTNILAQVEKSMTDLTQHTFTGLALSTGVHYYLFVKYEGTSGKESPWSAASEFEAIAPILVADGRYVYRGGDNYSVVCWSGGKFAVADAVHRVWSSWAANIPESIVAPFIEQKNNTGYACIYKDRCGGEIFDYNSVTEAQLAAEWTVGKNADSNTAEQNYQLWVKTYMNYITGSGSAWYYTNRTLIEGKPCRLPNKQELIRIYCCKDTLDKLDPYGSSTYPTLKSVFSVYSSSHGAWSSTAADSYNMTLIDTDGVVDTDQRSDPFWVLPILELE